MIALVYWRLRPTSVHLHNAVILRRGLVSAGAVLLVSLVLAYLLIPKSDPQVYVIWYGAVVGSIPVLLPAIVACFLRVRERSDAAAPQEL